MTLQQLEYFRVMAKVLHYTKAAEMLYISNPVSAMRSVNLKRNLAIPLFEKNGKKPL
jgi:DNA-binding transcriptional LysR family regulator